MVGEIISKILDKGEVFRRNHLIQFAEQIKPERPIVTFPKNDRFLSLFLSNQINCSKNILLNSKNLKKGLKESLFDLFISALQNWTFFIRLRSVSTSLLFSSKQVAW